MSTKENEALSRTGGSPRPHSRSSSGTFWLLIYLRQISEGVFCFLPFQGHRQLGQAAAEGRGERAPRAARPKARPPPPARGLQKRRLPATPPTTRRPSAGFSRPRPSHVVTRGLSEAPGTSSSWRRSCPAHPRRAWGRPPAAARPRPAPPPLQRGARAVRRPRRRNRPRRRSSNPRRRRVLEPAGARRRRRRRRSVVCGAAREREAKSRICHRPGHGRFLVSSVPPVSGVRRGRGFCPVWAGHSLLSGLKI